MKLNPGNCLVLASLLLAACSSAPVLDLPVAQAVEAQVQAPTAISFLRHLGTVYIDRESTGVLQHFGGISGADRDPQTGTWYLLSDDKSEYAPARIYTANIVLDERGLHGVRVTGIITLLQRDGTPYPGPGARGEVPDPEAIRIDPQTGMLVWSSEGDRHLGLDPFIRIADRSGRYAGEIPIPSNFRFDKKGEKGGRHNLTLEGLAFSRDGQELWAAMETALYQDGDVAAVERGTLARVARLSRDGTVLAQYAYPVDAIPIPPSGGKKRADNGISEILSFGKDRLLVMERSGHEVDELVFKFAVRIYEATAEGATDIRAVDSLRGADVVPMKKRLLLDLNKAGLGEIDNLEAAAWGPRLPNGHATLLLISDDNFAPSQRNQVMAFEVIEP